MKAADPRSFSSNLDQRIGSYLQRLKTAVSCVMMLDYDGTLAPFSDDRERAYPYPGIPEVLDELRRETDTRLLIVSGRPVQSTLHLLGIPGIEIWGCHGLERLSADGIRETAALDARPLRAIAVASERLKEGGLEEFAEHKPGGIAIHWRGREVLAGQLRRKVEQVWSNLQDKQGLRLVPFDGGMEIVVAARTKGDAVRKVLSETDADAAVAYLGDDTTDEDAFAALRGHGLNILVREEYRMTLADAWIRPPEDVKTFLRAWTSARRAGRWPPPRS